MNFSQASEHLIKPFLSSFVDNKYNGPVSPAVEPWMSAVYSAIASVDTQAVRVEAVSPPVPLPTCLARPGKYVPEEIRQYINSTPITQQFIVQVATAGCKVYVSFFQDCNKKAQKMLQEKLQDVYVWLTLCKRFAINKTCAETLTIHVFMTPFEKCLPEVSSGQTLSVAHVNSAFTLDCAAHGEIVVYREEEWFKVLLHETFHAFGLDVGSSRLVSDKLRSLFQITSDFHAAESYAETFARIWTGAFCSFRSSKGNLAHFMLYMEFSVQLERQFAIFQCHKVLRYMGLTYADIIRRHTGLVAKYQEDTNVFAYYILTALLLNDYPAFIGWCQKHNPTLLQFARDDERVLRSFNRFIEKHYLDLKNTPHMDDFARTKKGANAVLQKTTRMSLL